MLNKRHGPVLIDLPKNIMSSVTEQENIQVKEIMMIEII
jgi:thiamine pyrophosphate-dependent acetolactate synthase large subunit-like protein